MDGSQALNHGTMSSLTNDTIVDIWVNSADARKVLDQGYRIVHASADYFYLVSVPAVAVT